MTGASPIEVNGVVYTDDFEDLTNPFHPQASDPFGLSIESPSWSDEEQLDIPESLLDRKIEVGRGEALVYSMVKTKCLGDIATNGLLRRKNSVGTKVLITHESTFFVERPEQLAEFDRTRSLYAVPHAPPPEEATSYDRSFGHFTYLELLVNTGRVLVADQQFWNDARQEHDDNEYNLTREELVELIRPLAQRYWGESMSLSDYLAGSDSSQKIPEIIIPFDIPPENLRIFSPTPQQS